MARHKIHIHGKLVQSSAGMMLLSVLVVDHVEQKL